MRTYLHWIEVYRRTNEGKSRKKLYYECWNQQGVIGVDWSTGMIAACQSGDSGSIPGSGRNILLRKFIRPTLMSSVCTDYVTVL